MSKHTPGPWSIYNKNDTFGNAPVITIKGGPGSFHVDKVAFLWTEGGDNTYVEQLHNAALIAAAPDMLEMLYLALPYIETAENDPAYKKGAVNKLTKKIRAVIAKAEGE